MTSKVVNSLEKNMNGKSDGNRIVAHTRTPSSATAIYLAGEQRRRIIKAKIITGKKIFVIFIEPR